MNMTTENCKILYESNLKSLNKVYQGKVRDIYEVDSDHMLIVTTDRLSAFDVILPDPIPKKGMVLNIVSNFWFDRFSSQISNHLSDIKIQALPFEAIVRGYVIGSGWKEYQSTGTICDVKLPENLKLAQQLDQPIFTPSTKAAVGEHDVNVNFNEVVNLVGKDIAEKVRSISLSIYKDAAKYAATRGIIIADTKFEFGLDKNGSIVLIDEALTPDSSRFWPQSSHTPGENPKSYDKQYVRDYLETLDWNKKAPGPHLPPNVIANTSKKYLEVCEILTGQKL